MIQHAGVEGPWLIGEALLAAGVDVVLTRIDRGDSVPPTLFDEDGLVVLGGPMSAHQQGELKHLRKEMALIELAMMADKPMLGVCLGSQLLATVLGAKVEAGPKKEIGFFDVTLGAAAKADPLLGGLPERFAPLHWHGDVFELPFGSEALASSEQTAHQAFRKGSAWGLLFHLEAQAEQVAAMARAFEDELRGAGVDPRALVEEAREREDQLRAWGRAVFDRFAAAVARVSEGGEAVAHDESAEAHFRLPDEEA